MYKDYIHLYTDFISYFGGYRGDADDDGSFCLHILESSTSFDIDVCSRLIIFGD